MKTIKDLKIGDIVWKVDNTNSLIDETIIESLSKKLIETSKSDYVIPKDSINLDRIKNHYNTTLCITYLDAVDLATTICTEKIKEHSQVLIQESAAIETIGLRIHELNDIKQNLV